MNRSAGGVALAFAGFVVIVAAFKGTWRQTIDALTGNVVPTASAATGPATAKTGSGFPGTSVIPGSSGNPLARAAR